MNKGQKIIAITPAALDSESIIRAGKIIQNNGVVIFPAKCLYGIATNALNETAVAKIFNLKQRPRSNPILVLIPDRTMLKDLVKSIPESATRLMDAFWPGNLTLVFEARDTLPKSLTAGTGKIGIRLPVHPVAKALVDWLKSPITGTSANLSGQESCNCIGRLDPAIRNAADLVLDAGTLKGGKGSSIVDITGPAVNIIREGEVRADRIRAILSR